MTRVIFARHGETIWHQENRYAGISDVPLTDLGREQAIRLGEWAVAAELDAIYTSTLSRAIDTARPAAEATNLTPTADPRIVEVNFGEGEGMTRGELESAIPDAFRIWLDAPGSLSLPGGETGNAAVERALSFLDELVAAHPNERVLVVAHSTLIRLVLSSLLGIPTNEYREILPAIDNVALTEFQFTGQPSGHLRPQLLRYNASIA